MRNEVWIRVEVAIAIVAGIVIGACAFIPLYGGTRLARKATATSSIGEAGGLLLGVLGSFTILALAAIICIIAFRAFTLPFVIALALSVVVTTVIYGIKKQLR